MEQWIEQARDFVQEQFAGEGSGHDWWHIVRVVNNAKRILHEETEADASLVVLCAWLHDVGDHKFFDGDEAAGMAYLQRWMEERQMPASLMNQVLEVVRQVSYKGAGVITTPTSLEAKIVQDADRLDAIGAIGIARAFSFGGNRGRLMYDPEVPAEAHQSFEAYKNNHGTTVNHFYEKLLLLKERMNTQTAQQLAEQRHDYMEEFLERFFTEWEGRQ